MELLDDTRVRSTELARWKGFESVDLCFGASFQKMHPIFFGSQRPLRD
jgi:hypothetical protein